jgi:hypothetical protein
MSRKSLFFGSIVLLLTMLFALTGCDNPAGPAGPQGPQGPESEKPGPEGPEGPADAYLSGDAGGAITDIELALAFELREVVVLGTSVTSVYGKVPARKTLYVLGPNTAVTEDEKLTIEDGATINIWHKTSKLAAAGIPTAGGVIGSGLLVPATGASITITGNGEIYLPIIVYSNTGTFNDGLHYDSDEVAAFAARYPRSAIISPTAIAPVPFLSTHIGDFFENRREDQLAVAGVADLDDGDIPAGKTLTLKGPGNRIPAAFVLGDASGVNATLIVDEGAELLISENVPPVAGTPITLTANGSAKFINRGTVTLGPDDTINLAGSATNSIYNDGLIIANTVTTELEKLLKIPGSEGVHTGTIQASVSTTLTTGAVLNQNLKIPAVPTTAITISGAATGATKLFDGFTPGKNIIIEKGNPLALPPTLDGILSLDDETTEFGIGTGEVVKNGGVITTATTSSLALKNIIDSTGGKGTVEATGAITQLLAAFEIPEKTVLTIGVAGTTFASTSEFGLTVNGILNLGTATVSVTNFQPSGNTIVNGTVNLLGASPTYSVFTVAGTKTLDISSTASFSGSGLLKVASPAPTTSIVKIDGVSGYSFNLTTGLMGSAYKDALAEIRKVTTQLALAPAITPDSSFGTTRKVAGAIVLSAVADQPLTSVDTGVNSDPEKFIKISTSTPPSQVGLTLPTPPDYDVEEGNIPETAGFVLGVGTGTPNPLNVLTLRDPAFTGSAIKWGVISFTGVRVDKNGLIGPQIGEKIYIAVKTQRAS